MEATHGNMLIDLCVKMQALNIYIGDRACRRIIRKKVTIRANDSIRTRFRFISEEKSGNSEIEELWKESRWT